ncbi:hypothetical protein [Gelidibacter salicanalis]|uniref:FecR domain-containing protein n=1 Tax=Gelidibacter salicanalis TaxID=291193 RepID=A0A934KMT2_9FLAO|nr:hypothetical protein [Gelidibacter salicanalis]MBJ7882112.1 hypothetical protein [Gelidibacter salicanalis]
MKKFNAKKIIVKYLANEATPLEEEQLLNWVNSEKNQRIFKEFVKAQQLIDIAYNNTIDQQTDFNEFLEQIHHLDVKSRKFQNLLPYIKYAAVLIGVFLASQYYLNKQHDTTPFVDFKNEISLQIMNGDTEYFSIDTDKTIISKNGDALADVSNGVLKYLPSNSKISDVQIY